MAKRSSGVVLIVTLLAWSVNLPAIACPAMNSWAAVMMQAGTSPAPEPEPSPSRHSCCPAQKVTRTQTQPADRNCTFHAKPGPGCCSVTSNPVSTPLPQIVTKPNLLEILLRLRQRFHSRHDRSASTPVHSQRVTTRYSSVLLICSSSLNLPPRHLPRPNSVYA